MYGWKQREIDAFNSLTQTCIPWARERVHEPASERMSAAERASEASSAEQANEWAVRANERADERMAQYSTRRFHNHSIKDASLASWPCSFVDHERERFKPWRQ